MNASEIAARLKGEEVGGRVVVHHHGKREYATDLENGRLFLNDLGRELLEALDVQTLEQKSLSKRGRKPDEDVTIEV